MGKRVAAEQNREYKREGVEMETGSRYRVVRDQLMRLRQWTRRRGGEERGGGETSLRLWNAKRDDGRRGRLAFHGPSMQHSGRPVCHVDTRWSKTNRSVGSIWVLPTGRKLVDPTILTQKKITGYCSAEHHECKTAYNFLFYKFIYK